MDDMSIKKQCALTVRSIYSLSSGHWLHGLGILCCMYVALYFSGCSMVVLAGKVFMGDPKQPAKFKMGTGTNLEKGKHRILVVASAPYSANLNGHALDLDILDGVTRRIKRKGVKVVSSAKVSTWMDDNGGVFNDPDDLLEDFETDFIVHIAVESYSYLEENSTSMYRGRCAGTVTVYEVVEDDDDQKKTVEVWSNGFSSLYPQAYPISHEQVTPELFQQRFTDRLNTQLAQLFYAHLASEAVE